MEDRSPEEVAASARMTPDAVYAWRSRLRKLANHLATELAVTAPAPARTGKQVAA